MTKNSSLIGIIESKRLIIRPFVMGDLHAVHQILDNELADANFGTEGIQTLSERKSWLKWLILNYEQLSKLKQSPYGERAIVVKGSKELIGVCGYVPCLDRFEQLCDFNQTDKPVTESLATTEFGLFYAISKRFQGYGFATEAALEMTEYAFKCLKVKKIIATTTYDNAASINVMRKLGMNIKKNSLLLPAWLQIVGILHNPSANLNKTNDL